MTTGSRTEGIRGIGTEGFIRTVKNLTVTGDLVVHGETRSTVGTGHDVSAFWEVADANANYWAYELPSGGSVAVPVMGVGIGLKDVDLGLFDGVTQTTFAVLDADRDSYLILDFSADDSPRIRSNQDITVSGNVVFSDNITVNGTTTTVSSSVVIIDDPLFHLANDNPANSVDLGIIAEYTDSGKKFAGLFRDASDSDKWKLFATTGNSHEEPSTTVNTTSGFTLANLAVNELDGTLTTASQTNITAVGTIATGTWEGTTIAVDQGGTGATTLNNLITLTTHTTGNYVATITGGTGIDSDAATSGEGTTHTLSVDLAEVGEVAIADGDYIAFMDATDSNATKKEALADVATLFAGTGLTAASSVIGVDAAQSGITSLGTLTGLALGGNKSVTPGDGAMVHLDSGTITDSNTSGSGTAALYTHVRIEAPTLAATNSSVTTTSAATLYINAAATAGTNQTITNNYALWVDAGTTRLDGDLIPGADDTYDLGSASAAWQDLFLEGDITLTDAGKIDTSAGDLTLDATGNVIISGSFGHVGIGNTSPDLGTGRYLTISGTGNEKCKVVLQNADPSNASAIGEFQFYSASTNVGAMNCTLDSGSTNSSRMQFYTGASGTPTLAMTIDSAQILHIGDTANANITTGLSINQGAADNQILAVKSSDVAQAMTGVAEADTYGAIQKAVATEGGLEIIGLSEADRGIQMTAYVDSVNTTHTAGGEAAVVIQVSEHDGSNGVGNPSADANLFAVGIWDGSSLGLKFIVDEDGDIFYDGAAAAYDTYDDAALARAFDLVVSPDKIIRNQWDDFVGYNEATLVDAGILGDTRENRGLINATQLQRLHNGAISQMREDMMSLVRVLSTEQQELLPSGTRSRLALGGA